VYEFESRSWKKRAPKNVASKKDFYILIDEEGRRREEIEKALSTLESKAASIFRNKIQIMERLNHEERAIIAEFIATMMTRVPKFHYETDSFISEIAEFEMRMIEGSPDKVKELKEQYEKETGDKLPEGFGPSDFDPSRYKISATKSFLLDMMLSPIREARNIIYRMTWTFLHTIGQARFITSDSPYFMLNPKSPRNGQGLLHQGIKVSLPFSSKICLLADWGKTAQRHINISDETADLKVVEVFNRLRIEGADKFIISCKRGFIGVQKLPK